MKSSPSRRKFLKTAGKGALAGSIATLFPVSSFATQQPSTVRVAVFWETNFPSIRGLNVTRELLQQALGQFNPTFLSANDLAQLNPSTFDLLVMPYGEAFPKSAWRYLLAYLRGGGNWLNLGGVPLGTPALRSGNQWRAQDRQTAYHKQLGIMHAFPVSATDIASYKSEQFRFTAEEVYQFNVKFTSSSFFPDEGGSDGPREAMLNALAFGLNKTNRAIAAPIIQIDRLQGAFTGGRWVLASFKGTIEPETVRRLAQHAAEGAIRFHVNSEFACYHAGEKPSFVVATEFPNRNRRRLARDISNLEIRDSANKLISALEVKLDDSGRGSTKLDVQLAPGFYRVDAQALVNNVSGGSTYPLRYTSGFWIYDASLIATARPLTVDNHWFYRDGEVFPVTGTTYMASDVHRQFLFEPNAFVWDNDFREMKAAGVNMVRTGLWNSWKKYMPEVGKVSEIVLRAMDAFILTARKHDIPVIFTFFAFIPEAWGGQNSYLDPQALSAQKQFIWAFAERFSKVDDLMWDFINEPSFGSAKHVWSCRPNYDDHEKAAWRDWLKQRYPAANDEERAAELQQVWRTTSDNPYDLPRLEDFEGPIIFDSRNPLKTLDYRLFAQDMFIRWVRQMSEPIRRNGNAKQLITVGQDENGLGDSPNPQFFADTVDFTSLHNWWNNDDLVWDSVLSKVSNKANLVEETGLMFYEKTGGEAWRTDQDARDLLDRKMATCFAAGGGAGFIEWVWNTNPYMDITNEAAIGFHRVDGTAKPELEPFLDIAAFMKKNARRFRDRQSEEVQMVIPHSQMFTPRNYAFEATRKSIRAMYYHCRVPSLAVSEYTLNKLAVLPKLIIVPAARVLTESCWQALLAAANRGSTVAITGVIDEDQHWRRIERTTRFSWSTTTEPVLDSEVIRIGTREMVVRFEGDKLQRVEKAVVRTKARDQGSLPARVLTARHGQGQILWSPLPLELADSLTASSEFYRVALAQAGISPLFTLLPDTPSVLVIPSQFRDTMMYTFVSEADEDMKLQLLHRATNTRLPVLVRAGRTVMLLLDRKTGTVIDSTSQ